MERGSIEERQGDRKEVTRREVWMRGKGWREGVSRRDKVIGRK